ncbi:hypothetical protein [Myxosarcina sp. GI1(2024)]
MCDRREILIALVMTLVVFELRGQCFGCRGTVNENTKTSNLVIILACNLAVL